MIDQDTQPPDGSGGEAGDDRRQVVDAAEVLDHDADVAQVVAPDLLHKLGVVAALDVDPAGARHLGPALRRGDRARRGPPGPAAGAAGIPWAARDRPGQPDRLALQQEGVGQREHPPLAVAVLQGDGVLLAEDHGAAEAARAVLDDQAALGRDPRQLRLARPLARHREYVTGVSRARSRPLAASCLRHGDQA